MSRNTNAYELLFLLITIIISVGFGTFLSMERVTDPFLYYDISYIKSIKDDYQMSFPESGPFKSLDLVPGRLFLLSQYMNMMGIDPEALQFLPLGSILTSATLYIIGLKIFKAPIIASLLTLYLMLNLSHASALYSVFAYGIALPILFGIVLIYMRLNKQRKVIDVVILLLLFVAANLIHYTIATWIILFFIGANMVVGFRSFTNKDSQNTPGGKSDYYITLALIVIFIAFNQTLYESYLPFFGAEAFEGAFNNFLSYLSVDLSEKSSSFLFPRSTAIGIVSTMTLILILLPIIAGLFLDLWNFVKRYPAKLEINSWTPIIGGILFIGIVDSASYSIRGSISTKAISMLFPLLTLYYIQRIGKSFLTISIAMMLLVTSLIKIGVFYENGYVIGSGELKTPIESIQASSDWLQEYENNEKYYLLADLNLYGKYMLTSVNYVKESIFMSFEDDSYAKVIGEPHRPLSNSPDFVAIDLASTEPVIGFVWGRYKPLQENTVRILDNPGMNLIYDDGSIWLATPTE
jgi:hypothetical protein